MTEISKMFENAGIKGEWRDYRTKNGKIYEGKNPKNRNIRLCKPRFTAEKQLNIFKMFCNRYLEISQHVEENGDLCFGIKTTVSDYIVAFDKDFAECLACFVNNYWSSLTDQEKEEIRNILR
jgi:hypothetical protein